MTDNESTELISVGFNVQLNVDVLPGGEFRFVWYWDSSCLGEFNPETADYDEGTVPAEAMCHFLDALEQLDPMAWQPRVDKAAIADYVRDVLLPKLRQWLDEDEIKDRERILKGERPFGLGEYRQKSIDAAKFLLTLLEGEPASV